MNKEFYIINDDNETIKCEIFHCFKNNNDNFMFYNDGSINEDGTLKVLASKFTIEDNKITLIPILDNEWDIVDKKWGELYEKA